MRPTNTLLLALLLAAPCASVAAQGGGDRSFERAASDVRTRLQLSLRRLDELRRQILAEKLPLGTRLSELESELTQVRQDYREKSRLLETSALELQELSGKIKRSKDEAGYLSNLLSEYGRNLESKMHIAEKQRYLDVLEGARLAGENTILSEAQVFETQVALVNAALDRLEDGLGGTRFKGRALDREGLVKEGEFALVGPAALFRSTDGQQVGTVEQLVGSNEPTVIPFADPGDARAATLVVSVGDGDFPLDPTLGNAHKIERTRETFVQHVEKGGAVMIPIFAMAGLALLIALYKWLSMLRLRNPSSQDVDRLLDAVGRHDHNAAMVEVARMHGPVGRMLTAGVEHLGQPRALIEEVMYEVLLKVRLRLQRMLPFIAICAASAPLLGLLGTVTGIIKTFKTITVQGAGDVKSLSGGISEALITTEFGLIVAIPSLLIHAFLSRRVKNVLGQMESTALAFANQVSRTPPAAGGDAALREGSEAWPSRNLVRAEVRAILGDLMGPDFDSRLDEELEQIPVTQGAPAERDGREEGR